MKYLIKSHNTYVFKIRVPKALQSHPLFESKTFIQKSLKTDSLSEAIRLRDLELAKIQRLKRGDALSERSYAFESLVARHGHPLAVPEGLKDSVREVIEEKLLIALEDYTSYEVGLSGYDAVYSDEADIDPNVSALVDYRSILNGEAVEQRATLREALEKTVSDREGKIAAKQLQRYRTVVESFLELFSADDLPLSNIQKGMVQHFINREREKGLTDKTIVNKVSSLSTIYTTAANYSLVSGENPFSHPNLSRSVTRRREHYSRSQVEDIYSVLPDDSKLIWKTLYYTGLRPSELFKLTSEDILKVEARDKDVVCFSVAPNGDGKTDSATRLIPLHADLLDEYLSFDGFSISQSTFEKRRRKAVIGLFGEDFANTHDTYSLRHTFTTTLVSELNDVDLVKWLVGHSRAEDVTFHSYFHGYGLEKLEDAVNAVPSLDCIL